MPLHDLQIELAEWIRAPEGVAKALEGATETETAAAREDLERLIRSDGNLDATLRLEIYANAYFYRVLGVLAQDFEALRGRFGEPLFHDLVTSYLWIEPSRHPSLRYAGQHLPRFLETDPAAAVFRDQAPWSPELAAFEWARVDAFDAPDAPVLSRTRVATRRPEEFDSLELTLGPWVQLRSFSHPVDRLWKSGIEGAAPPPEEVASETRYVIWRRQERVVHRRVDRHEADALALLGEGATFGEVCELAARGLSAEEVPARVASWLEAWLGDGLLIDAC